MSGMDGPLMGRRETPLEPRKTSGTVYVRPEGDASIMRVTCYTDGLFEVTTKARRGERLVFDPEKAEFMGGDAFINVAAENGVRILGAYSSAARFDEIKLTHAAGHIRKNGQPYKRPMTLDQLLAHAHYGKTMPSREVIIEANRKHREANELG